MNGFPRLPKGHKWKVEYDSVYRAVEVTIKRWGVPISSQVTSVTGTDTFRDDAIYAAQRAYEKFNNYRKFMGLPARLEDELNSGKLADVHC